MEISYFEDQNNEVKINYDSDINDLTTKLQKLKIFKPETKQSQFSFPAMLKVYHKDLKINQPIEAIGILSINKPPSYKENMDIESEFKNFSSKHPNYLVPRIHCLDIQPINLDNIVRRNLV